MHTLLLRLAGPMQSWGTQSRFLERDTGQEPSKSGVLGLICAALGRPRTEPLDDLAALRMGVRVDREGIVRRDYQSAMCVVQADGTLGGTVVSNRYYLADADFLVGLAGNDLPLLQRIDAALAAPQWTLSLGRKAFVPGLPVRLPHGGVRVDTTLDAALRREPWRSEQVRAVLEVSPTRDAVRRFDQPGPGAAFLHRQFLPRHVVIEHWEINPRPHDAPFQEDCHV